MEPNSTRISDAERDDAVAALTRHVATGRLDIAEFDERAASTYAAVTRADLGAVFADLPTGPTAPAAPQVKAVNAPTDAREWLTWASVGTLCVIIWAVTSIATGNFLYPWPLWVIGPWGAMLTLGRITGNSAQWGCAGSRRAFGDRAA